MSEHQTETAFLRHILLYDDGDERRKLEESIAQVQPDMRCVQRVASVTGRVPPAGDMWRCVWSAFAGESSLRRV